MVQHSTLFVTSQESVLTSTCLFLSLFQCPSQPLTFLTLFFSLPQSSCFSFSLFQIQIYFLFYLFCVRANNREIISVIFQNWKINVALSQFICFSFPFLFVSLSHFICFSFSLYLLLLFALLVSLTPKLKRKNIIGYAESPLKTQQNLITSTKESEY